MVLKRLVLKRFPTALMIAAAAFAPLFSEGNTSCRVRDIGGVPRLTLDGKPVRARMLYVSPLYFQLASPFIRTAFDDADVNTFIEIPPLKDAVDGAAIEFRAHKKFKAKIAF